MTNIENKKKAAKEIVKRLKITYGSKIPYYLNYNKKKPYECLFAVMLSAQCTDDRVNKVTKKLYKKYTTLKDFANANLKTLEKDIYEVGFYHNKAISLIETAKILLEKYNGKVPNDFDEMIKLKGVGRKTANVVLGKLYGRSGMAVDTHVNRISNKLFSLNEKDPDKVEKMLEEIIDKKDWNLWNTHIIALGRTICKSRKEDCENCFLLDVCEYNNKGLKNRIKNEKTKTKKIK